MNVAIIHNYYQQPGGEDVVFRAHCELLRSRGHNVYPIEFRNTPDLGLVRIGLRQFWSADGYRSVDRVLKSHRIDVVHCHNTFPLASPAVYYAARRHSVPVVQTLHNYRLLCPSGVCYRKGDVCVRCVDKIIKWPGVFYGCYRSSRLASAGVAAMTAAHRVIGTWENGVDAYVAMTGFGKTFFAQGGIPQDRITVLPHCIHPDPGVGEHRGRYALYVGRLVPEKGVQLLCDVWGRQGCVVPLKIVGDGPCRREVEALADTRPGIVEYLGSKNKAETIELMKDARVLVFPSEWYETFGLVVVEAMATGLPVIAQDIGSIRELVRDGETGVVIPSGCKDSTAGRLSLLASDTELCGRLGAAARETFESRFTEDVYYLSVIQLYRRAIARRTQPSSEGGI